MNKTKVEFMTTDGCHLCDQAYEMVCYLLETDRQISTKINLKKTEIANDDQLVELYGIRIPVLMSSKREIGWPFEIEELRQWLVKL